MIIKKAILHIIDLTRGVAVASNQQLDFTREDIREFIEKHISKALTDSNKREGFFRPESKFRAIVQDYGKDQMDFVSFSQAAMNRVYEEMSQTLNQESMDLLIIEFNENDMDYVIGLLWANQIAYTHHVITSNSTELQAEPDSTPPWEVESNSELTPPWEENSNSGDDPMGEMAGIDALKEAGIHAATIDQVSSSGGIKNEIIRHFGIIPSSLSKIDSYFLINLSKNELEFVDKKRRIAGDELMILPEKILEADGKINSREVVKAAVKIAKEVAEENDQDITMAVSKAKQYIATNGETSAKLEPAQLSKEVFGDNPELVAAFEEKISEKKLPKTVKVPPKYAAMKGGTHKIKTDTGIEITFPSSFAGNTEYLRFINNPNGTISIEIVNVGEIIDK